MNWSPQQRQALDQVGRWLRDPYNQVFYLAGYAGTGKTTLARHLIEGVTGLCLQAAYTGKAASVLRKRGFPEATTLHSILYKVQDPDTTRLRDLTRELQEATDEMEVMRLEKAIKVEKDRLRGPRFYLNPDSPLATASLLLVDEVSMVDRSLGEDILSFRKKVLVLGDPAQLPPVHGSGFFTKRDPDHMLTEIHRQAAENPIIRWSKMVREGEQLPFRDEGDARKVRKKELKVADMAEAGQVLCGKNETRRKINIKLRSHHGFRGVYPKKGDKLVVLRNDKDLGVLNGVVCEAAENTYKDPDGWYGLMIDYEGHPEPLMVDMDPSVFLAYKDPSQEEGWVDRNLLQLDFGYALTVHKSQGSQWEDVFIADDGFGTWNQGLRKKWLYTAITRAENTLTIAS